MDNVQIQILDSDNNIEGTLDVGNIDKFGLALTKSISDLKDINSQNGSYSLPFKIPSTKTNDDLLEHLYLSNHKNYKDFDAEKDCRIIVNGIDIDKGKVRITKIKRAGRTADDYSFEFFGENMDWAIPMRSKTTQDLPYLDNTFTYGQSEQIASWSNVGGAKTPLYSIINRGAKVQAGAVNVNDLYPDYFVLDYLNDAFKSVGYKFESTYFNASDRKQLIIPFFGSNFRDFDRSEENTAIVKMDSSATNFDSSFTIDGTAPTSTQISFVDKLLNYQGTAFTGGQVDFSSQTKVTDYSDSPAPLKDDANNFASNQYTVPYDNKYTVNGVLDYTIVYDPSDTWNSYNIDHRVKVTRGSQTIYLFAYPSNTNTTTTVINGNRTSVRTTANFNTSWFALQAGDVLELTYRFTVKENGNPVTNYYFSLSHFNNPIKFVPYNFFQEGDSFNWKDVSDNRISLLDIVSDIGKLHNIRWRTNRANKTVFAEPRDDFYNALSTADNYTDRLDNSKKIDITYNSKYYNRNHNFKYKEDNNDKYLAKRNDELQDDWMSYSHLFPDKFKEGTTNLETKVISSTYTINDIYSGGDYSFYTSRMWNDESLPPATTVFAPRVLYYKYGGQQTIDGQTCNFQYASESSKRTNIPYALPFPVVESGVTLADVDGVLSFKDVVNGSGLWTTHYSKTAREIQEGKRASVFFRFDLVDYNSLDFRKPIYIDNRYPELEGYWYIDKINNFKPTSNDLSVEFELIQAKNFTSLGTNTDAEIVTETATDIFNNNYNQAFAQVDTINSTSSTQRSVNTGNNNTVADDSNLVFGNNLRVTGSNQTALGQYNVDVSTDLFQLGTGFSENERRSIIRVDENGNTFFNGVQIVDGLGFGGGLVLDISSDTTAQENVDTYLVDTSGGDVTITLPINVYQSKVWYIHKKVSANSIIVEGDSDGMGSKYPINDDTTGFTMTVKYDTAQVKKITNQFIIV